ncbi:hypothetical protein VB773_17595 [Haloarculaceae archaeon H-GB2-1]|nr:hypothetical protein [Haloarculaceae archaeon H-GB11]MEA5409204.1 hypothetical protein [Haloarculaceae archaeon H-GB2-1]
MRAVLAVVLAVALLGVSLPALDEARVKRTDVRVGSELEGLADEMRLLQRGDAAVPSGTPGARVATTFSVPHRSWAAAGVEFVSLSTTDGGRARFGWRADGGRRHVQRVPDVRLSVAGPSDSLVLTTGGRHRLHLRLVRTDSERVVVVARPDV